MISTVLNVALQLIEALIVFYFYESVSDCKDNRALRCASIMLSYLLMCGCNLVFDYNVFVNVFFLFCFQMYFSGVLYKIPFKNTVMYSVVITLAVFATELIAISFMGVIFDADLKEYSDEPFQYLMIILFSKSLLFGILKIVSELIEVNNRNKKIDIAFFIYPFSVMIVMFDFSVIFYKTDLPDKIKILISSTGLIFVASIIIFCIFQQHTAEKEQELMELKTIREKENIEKSYFELLEHQNDELQIFVHDIQKHLENIGKLSDDSDDVKEYISALSNDNKIGKTSNKLLDLIIDKYNYLSEKQGITFEKNIHSSKFDFISQADLTSVFNNLLDNAVESAGKSEGKYISLSINSYGNILFVELVNSCDNPPRSNNDRLLTTKNDGGLHGFGFKSITKSVKKYNGDIEWEYDDDKKQFCITALFPLDEQKDK
ncbi:MAG: GHKL domain-containing protein [Clostridia bacterium]|nr:GHKL domain-containing protein [Clostridia bacterium]